MCASLQSDLMRTTPLIAGNSRTDNQQRSLVNQIMQMKQNSCTKNVQRPVERRRTK